MGLLMVSPGRRAPLFLLAATLLLTGLFLTLGPETPSAWAQTVPITITMSASDGDFNGDLVEGGSGSAGYKTITIALGRALTGSETITVPLTVVGATVTSDYSFGLQPTIQSGVS